MPDLLDDAAANLLASPPRPPSEVGVIEQRAARITRRRRRQRWMVPAVCATALGLVGALLMWPEPSPSGRVETADRTDRRVGLAPPARQGYPDDLHFVSPEVGFGLETACAGEGERGRCAFVVRRSVDGGATWTDASELREVDGAAYRRAPRLRMIDERRGWVHGGQVLSTDDGGATWAEAVDRRVPLLEVARDTTWAVAAPECESACSFTVLRAAPESRELREVSQARPGDPAQLVALSPQVGFVVAIEGERAVLHRTSDGGTTWQEAGTPCGFRGASLAARSASLLWLGCTREGGGSQFPKDVHRSMDGGRTWQLVARVAFSGEQDLGYLSPTGGIGDLLAISDTELVYSATGRLARLHRSTDGGRTWTSVLEPGWDSGMSLGFLDDRHGWAWLSHSEMRQLHRTMDGGHTWKQVYPTEPRGGWPTIAADRLVQPTDVQFISADVGFGTVVECAEVACTVVTLRTNDGGSTWKQRGEPLHVRPQAPGRRPQMVFDAAERGWLRGGTELLRTQDGGAGWHVAPAPGLISDLDVAGPLSTTWSVARRDCGQASCPVHVLRDLTLTPADPGLAGGQLEELRIIGVSDSIAFVVKVRADGGPTHFRTRDGGATWDPGTVPCPDAGQELHVAARSARDLWAACVAEGGNVAWVELFASTDGGDSWALRAAARPTAGRAAQLGSGFAGMKHISALDVTASGTLILSGASSDVGTIDVSRDGGRTWTTSLSGDGVGAVHVLDDRHWWAAWQRLDRTTDGGRTWTKMAR